MAGEAPTDTLEWYVEVVERYAATDRSGRSVTHGRWRSSGVVQGGLQYAMDLARSLREHNGAARLTAPAFEVTALRDSFAVKRLEARV